MTRVRLLMVAVGVLGLLSGLAGDAGAGGGSPQGPTPCLSDKTGGGTQLRGTVTVEVTATDLNNSSEGQDITFTLRLERSGVIKFFRLHFDPADAANLNGMTNEQIACVMLGSPTLVQQILDGFGLSPARTQLVINDRSITNAEDRTNPPLFPGETNHIATMADITLYAMP